MLFKMFSNQVLNPCFTLSSLNRYLMCYRKSSVLAKEATAIAIWAMTQNVDCCKHWDSLYKENLEASVALLKRLVEEWKEHSLKLSESPSNTAALNRTMKSFRLKVTMPLANVTLHLYVISALTLPLMFLERGSNHWRKRQWFSLQRSWQVLQSDIRETLPWKWLPQRNSHYCCGSSCCSSCSIIQPWGYNRAEEPLGLIGAAAIL